MHLLCLTKGWHDAPRRYCCCLNLSPELRLQKASISIKQWYSHMINFSTFPYMTARCGQIKMDTCKLQHYNVMQIPYAGWF